MRRVTLRSVGLLVGIGLLLTLTSCVLAPPPSGQAPRGPLSAEFHAPDWYEGDCAYHAVTVAADGKVYFTVSSHVAQQSAHLFQFDPAGLRTRLLWDVGMTVTNDGSVTQGKIHAPLAEGATEFYLTTHSSWYHKDHVDPKTGKTQKPYPGGYVLAIDKQTGGGRIVAQPLGGISTVAATGDQQVPMRGEGLIASIFDARRGAMYVSSWPGAILARVDIRTGQTVVSGPRQGKCETVPDKDRQYQRALRTLALDDAGRVYGSTGAGEIWKYDPVRNEVSAMRSRMGKATRASMPSEARHLNMWRTIVWDDRDRVFYGVHWATSWLFKFDPREDRVEPILPWRPLHMREARISTDYAQLGFAMGPGHVLYGFVHAPATKQGLRRSVHLITYDLDNKTFKDHGYVLDQRGMALMFAESCAVASDGDVYTVGWVEVPPALREEVLKRRAQGPSETREETYVMALVRVPAANIRLDAP